MVMFCMQVMEPLRCRPFVLVYAYANTYGGGGGGEEGEGKRDCSAFSCVVF